jgi:hypothetical protein
MKLFWGIRSDIFIASIWLVFWPLVCYGEGPVERPEPLVSRGNSTEGGSSDATMVFREASKCVVTIEVATGEGKAQGSGVNFLNGLDSETLKANGTFVVSNAHVLKDAKRASVLHGGKRYEAVVDYLDDDSDLAILLIDGVALPVCKPYSGNEVEVGERVFAIGSPLGLENSMAEGIISGKRELNGILYLQTTAPISHGSSGGALFDAKVRFIGVTTFKVVGGENLNFAVDAGRVNVVHDAHSSAGFVPYMLKDQLSPGEIASLNSSAFTKWLLQNHAENGKTLDTEIVRVWQDAARRSDREKDPKRREAIGEEMNKALLQIAMRFLSERSPSGSPTAQDDPKRALLVCSVAGAQGQYAHDESLELNYEDRMVNRRPATFTDSEVKWTETRGKMDFYGVLNRYSGSIVIYRQDSSKGRSPLFFGKCREAKERKF